MASLTAAGYLNSVPPRYCAAAPGRLTVRHSSRTVLGDTLSGVEADEVDTSVSTFVPDAAAMPAHAAACDVCAATQADSARRALIDAYVMANPAARRLPVADVEAAARAAAEVKQADVRRISDQLRAALGRDAEDDGGGAA